MLTLADGMTRIALALRESPERHRLLKSELLALYLADLVQHQGPFDRRPRRRMAGDGCGAERPGLEVWLGQ